MGIHWNREWQGHQIVVKGIGRFVREGICFLYRTKLEIAQATHIILTSGGLPGTVQAWYVLTPISSTLYPVFNGYVTCHRKVSFFVIRSLSRGLKLYCTLWEKTQLPNRSFGICRKFQNWKQRNVISLGPCQCVVVLNVEVLIWTVTTGCDEPHSPSLQHLNQWNFELPLERIFLDGFAMPETMMRHSV